MSVPLDAATTGEPVELSLLEFDVLVEHLGLGAVPLVLRTPSPGRTHTERRELVEGVWRSVEERKLGANGELDEELGRVLRLLDSPRREVDGRCWLGRSVRVLVAGTGCSESDEAVLVVKEEDRVRVRPAATTGMPREALTVLPDLPAGEGRSVTLPSEALDAAAEEAADDPMALRDALYRRGVRAEDAEMLTGMLDGVNHRGQFGVAVRGRSGRRRGDHVVGFFDSAGGRYAQLRTPAPSGEPWSTITPVGHRGLLARVEELLLTTAERALAGH
ncbi:ESX secretion-associated protein EspG [Actinopolyspora mortivallis]|uniref:ESX secretion-associated protein EspG n=1 Tax=Actinopolyspora mortivallis TaxID=33906 RepID=A0A2T0GTT3_ACTMO|nr:ESX secretion-associated protein EspG [Actinopolyspora mortivallis]